MVSYGKYNARINDRLHDLSWSLDLMDWGRLLIACLSHHRFDAELNKSQEEVRDERNLREKLQRERDQLASAKLTLEQDLQVRIVRGQPPGASSGSMEGAQRYIVLFDLTFLYMVIVRKYSFEKV